MKILCCFGRYAYGDPDRGESYEHANFFPALKNLGHKVVLFDTFDRARFRNFADLNQAFLETVESEQPDIVLCVLMGYELWQETLALVRSGPRPVLINWGTDDSWKYEEFSRYVSPAFDIYATTSNTAMEKARREGHGNFVKTQWAANSHFLRAPKRASDCIHAVSFVGAAYGDRPKKIEFIRNLGIKVSCFGFGWEGGVVGSDEIPEIVSNSVVSLNFSDPGRTQTVALERDDRQIKARVFEVTGMGGCLLTESAPGLESFFEEGREIEVFSSREELAKKLQSLLGNSELRDRIALAGYGRTAGEHTYERRFEALFGAISRAIQDETSTKSPNIDWAAFEKIASRHKLSAMHRVIRWLLTTLCVAIWGVKRGPRAARHLVFELSWRISGSHTYSSAGWPGRMFYHES